MHLPSAITGFSPEWPAPASVRSFSTFRYGGVSLSPFDSFNLALHVGDDPRAVATNRADLQNGCGVQLQFIDQVHGIEVRDAVLCKREGEAADALQTDQRGLGLCILTADCLPVLFCNHDGTQVAAAHAGWRGLCAGILEATLATFRAPPSEVMAWLGPCIGPSAFEVGAVVRDAFSAVFLDDVSAFSPSKPGHWYADLRALAKARLTRAGVGGIFGVSSCTYSEPDRFFSYRRDARTGRMASLIWIE
jgi:polyphenol oxidase